MLLSCVFALRTAKLWLLLQFRDAGKRPLATAVALTALAAAAVALALALGYDLSPLEPLLGAVRDCTTLTCPSHDVPTAQPSVAAELCCGYWSSQETSAHNGRNGRAHVRQPRRRPRLIASARRWNRDTGHPAIISACVLWTSNSS